ncbi:MAG TPA: hypothetical protein VNQ31_07665 [Sphingomonadaceae bacterium]|nr:hypothetical protein [Sphingomonadaceae bacterium]
MTSLVDRRRRIVRVRRVQHLQAAAEAARAEGKVVSLEASAARLAALRMSLGLAPGTVSGAALSNVGELAMRLDSVREGLTDAIVSARASAEQFAALRLEARIRQESAEKLGEQAEAALIEQRERRAPGGSRRRPTIGGGA